VRQSYSLQQVAYAVLCWFQLKTTIEKTIYFILFYICLVIYNGILYFPFINCNTAFGFKQIEKNSLKYFMIFFWTLNKNNVYSQESGSMECPVLTSGFFNKGNLS